MALVTSGMPGPWSRATIRMPTREPFWAIPSTISPVWAYSMMFRASSEMAVATTVRSLPRKPRRAASERPRWRAVTTSAPEATWTAIRPRGSDLSTGISLAMGPMVRGHAPEIGEALLQVEHRGHVQQGQPQLDHGEGHLRLDAHDDGLGPPQPDHVGDGPEGAHGE